MPGLAQRPCQSCYQDAVPVAASERPALLAELPGWQIDQPGGVHQLFKVYRFADFAQALDFTNRVGALAEEVGHHPALLTEWGRVTVRWWTHAIADLHLNDFILAARTDDLARQAHAGA